jgi:enamine deaminase RidA (YjgF/YER057c/UK114 family)
LRPVRIFIAIDGSIRIIINRADRRPGKIANDLRLDGARARSAQFNGRERSVERMPVVRTLRRNAMRARIAPLILALASMSAATAEAAGGAEDNLKQKNIALPAPTAPVANYVPAVRVGNLLFLSGTGPDPSIPRGKVGKDLSLEQGYQAARSTGLNLLATARAALGSLDRVKRIVKVLGMVNSAPGFTDQPKVINGFSDLMVEVFGEGIGKHARSAVGMAELPFNIPVEIEMILEVAQD